MRILFLSNVFPNPLNPTKGTFNKSLIAALAQQHKVQVVSPISWIDELTSRFKHQQKIDRTKADFVEGVKTKYPRFYYPPKILRHLFGQFMWRSIQRQANKTIKQFRPEAILSYWAHPDGEVAVRLAQQAGIPAITMVGGSDVLLLARKGKRRAAIMNVLEQSNAIISVSQDITNHLKRDGIQPDKIHVVHRGVDCELFSTGDRNEARKELKLPTNQPILIAAGRLVDVKGHEVLISACQLLARQGRTFQCHIIGTGPLYQKLQEQIEISSLKPLVHLVGTQTQQQLANWYRAADMIVHPSYSEGIPNVLLEGMSCGTSFAASDVGGIPEVADSNYDQLVPPKEAKQLADAIVRQLDKQQDANRPERTFQPLTWTDSASKVVDVIQEAIDNYESNTDTSTVSALREMFQSPSLKEVSS